MLSCKQETKHLTSVQGAQLGVDSTLVEVDSIKVFVAPFKNRVDVILDSTLCYAPKSLLLNDGQRNTSMGNFLADLIYEETNPLVEKKIGKSLDFVVMNKGGIRSVLSKGEVTARNAYEIMPFENYISVVELNGTQVRKLVLFLANSKRAHAISGLEIVLDTSGGLESVNIQGKPFDENQNYHVATSDYLVSGGSDIGFFPEFESLTDTEYLLRNAIIDHFKRKDTLTAQVDKRFIQLQ